MVPLFEKILVANRGEIAIVGDFDEAEVTRTLKESLAGWKTDTPYARLVNKFTDIAPITRAIEPPDKENAVFRVRTNVEMIQAGAGYPALYLTYSILWGGA